MSGNIQNGYGAVSIAFLQHLITDHRHLQEQVANLRAELEHERKRQPPAFALASGIRFAK